jgi:predicted nucleic acid-binding protein
MKKVFADTAFFVAGLNQRDEDHENAKRLAMDYAGQVFTSYWVLLEVANYFAASLNRETAGKLIDSVLADPEVECIQPHANTFTDGLKLYRDRPDKNWSLTDCISFNLMRERGVLEALSSDHHFEQAGFRVLMK